MKLYDMGKAKFNIITTLSNQIITTVCGIVVLKIMLNSFGSEIYGITVSVTQFLSFISLLESGIGSVARARLYEPLARKDQREIGAVYYELKRFFRWVAALFLCYTIVLGLVYHDIAHVTIFSKNFTFLLVLVISISKLAKYMGGLPSLTLIYADQKQYIGNMIIMGATALNTAVVILLVWLKCNIIWVKLGSSLIFVIRPLLYTFYVRKHYALSQYKRGKIVLEQKWTGIGQHIAYFFHTNTDVVLLTLFADIRLVAVYSVYHLVIASIRSITFSFSGGMEAAFGEMIAKGQKEKLWNAYNRYKLLLSAATVVLFGCTGVLILPFVRLYTKGIADANYIRLAFALILLTAEAINCLMLPCVSLPIAANHIKQTRWGAYGEAVLNIVLSCILIRWNPLLGVAIGTLAATVFKSIYYMVYAAKHIFHVSVRGLLLKLSLTLALLFAVIFFGNWMLRFVLIRNYFQWMLCGIMAFAAVSLPVAAFALHCLKKRM